MTATVDRPVPAARSTAQELSRACAALLAGFFAVRPSLDLLVTFGLGPNLNLPLGGLLLLTLSGYLVVVVATVPDAVLPATSVAALALGASALISALGADQLPFSGAMAVRVVTVAVIFAACEQLAWRRPSSVHSIAIGAAAGLASTALVAAGQLAEWFPSPTGDGLEDTRVPGPFPAPTVFATCMMIVVALIIGLAPLWWRRNPNWIWLLGPVAVGSVYLLLANASRSPLGALLLAVVIIAFGQRKWLLIAPFALVAVALLSFNPSLIDRPLEVLDTSEENVIVGAEDNTFVFRVRYWERNLPLAEESPIIGIGIGGVEQRNGEGFPPHSTTVQAIIEMGIVGLIAHYALVITLAVALLRALRRARDVTTTCYLSVALGISTGYFVMSYFENLLTQVVTTGPVAAITGLALGLARRAERPPS